MISCSLKRYRQALVIVVTALMGLKSNEAQGGHLKNGAKNSMVAWTAISAFIQPTTHTILLMFKRLAMVRHTPGDWE